MTIYAEGDTELALDLLPSDLAEAAFEKLREEVKWNVMNHRGAADALRGTDRTID
jgi:hypothetical protein